MILLKPITSALICLGTTIVLAASHLVAAGEMHDAAERGDIAQVRELLASGASAEARDAYGNTVLHWAAVDGNPDLIKLVLNSGAPVNANNEGGATGTR